jgi:hypothetical protein
MRGVIHDSMSSALCRVSTCMFVDNDSGRSKRAARDHADISRLGLLGLVLKSLPILSDDTLVVLAIVRLPRVDVQKL